MNRGTTFRIYLPLVEEAIQSVRRVAAGGVTRGGSETILLAEDDVQLREIARSALVRLGYAVLAVEHGVAALELAGRHNGPIDLLVTDVVMPQMNGSELAARLGEARSGLRVLYLSGYMDRGITQDHLNQPGRAFLQKPFSPDMLAQRVRQLLDEDEG